MMKKRGDSSELVTKSFLKDEFISFERKIDENARKYRDEILTSIDGVMVELKEIREEITIGAQLIRSLIFKNKSITTKKELSIWKNQNCRSR